MRGCVCGRGGVCAARPQARLPRPQPDDSAGRARTRSGSGGHTEDESRSPGALPGVPEQLLSPNRCGFAESRGLGTMLVRARQSAQPVPAVRRTLFTHRFSRSA